MRNAETESLLDRIEALASGKTVSVELPEPSSELPAGSHPEIAANMLVEHGVVLTTAQSMFLMALLNQYLGSVTGDLGKMLRSVSHIETMVREELLSADAIIDLGNKFKYIVSGGK